MTHTYAIAEVSQSAYNEIRAVLVEAGYQHAIHDNLGDEVLDMHGIALRAKAQKCPAPEHLASTCRCEPTCPCRGRSKESR